MSNAHNMSAPSFPTEDELYFHELQLNVDTGLDQLKSSIVTTAYLDSTVSILVSSVFSLQSSNHIRP